jgi:hypothetical protein
MLERGTLERGTLERGTLERGTLERGTLFFYLFLLFINILSRLAWYNYALA